MTQNNPIHVALTSYGMSGRVFHAPLLFADKRFIISKIVERNSEKSKEKYPHITVVKQFEDVIADDDIALVVVNTPNSLHFEQGKAVLEAGKHLVLEKPATTFAWEMEKLIEIAERKGLILSVFQNRRWDGDFKTVKKVVENGLLGNLVSYESHFDRFRNYITPNTWKEETGVGSGIVYNLAAHLIDQALVLFGVPQGVTATIGTQRKEGKIDDFYDIVLDYGAREKGLQVLLKSSYLVREPSPRFALHGDRGSFVKYGLDPQEEALNKGFLPNTPLWGTEERACWGKLNTEIDGLHCEGQLETLAGSYADYYDNIYRAIREGYALEVKPMQAYHTIKIIELAYQSNREHKTLPYLLKGELS
ncbi:MAG: oxidoreductase [Cytophagales bacterium]|nr:MAG: oxidoreductase [Cytophagales bacterium]